MRVRFHEGALAELAREVQYYANITPPLGERFATVNFTLDHDSNP
jgi:hypothetical protein